MRLSIEHLKTAILDPDPDVRKEAVLFFSRSYSIDPTIVPRVIEAIEIYGWKDALKFYGPLGMLVQTEDSVDWSIRELQHGHPLAPEVELIRREACALVLTHADPALLRRFRQNLADLTAIPQDAHSAIEERIRYLDIPPEEMWSELVDLCEGHDRRDDELIGAIESAYPLVESLARHPERFAERVLSLLRHNGGEPFSWLEVCAIRLAGEMRLPAAMPWLIGFLGSDDLWADVESQEALLKLGTDEVVAETAKLYSCSTWKYRCSLASLLADVPSDSAFETACGLLKLESDRKLRMFLILAVLKSWDTRGIDLAREFVLEAPLDVFSAEIRPRLFRTCKITGVRFPDYEAWLADSENNDANRRVNHFYQQFRPDAGLRYGDEHFRYPIATVMLYGPNDSVTTKIVVSVVSRPDDVPIRAQWVGTSVMTTPKVRQQIEDFLSEHKVRSVIATNRNAGCPHEAGADYPTGQDCPFCPFWRGRQETTRYAAP